MFGGDVFLPVDRFIAGDLMSVCDKTEQAGRKVETGGTYHMAGQREGEGQWTWEEHAGQEGAGRDGGLGEMQFCRLRTKHLCVAETEARETQKTKIIRATRRD